MNNNRKKIFRTIVVIILCILYLMRYPFYLIAGVFRNLFLVGRPFRWIGYLLNSGSEYAFAQLSILLVCFIFLISVLRLLFFIAAGLAAKNKADTETFRSRPGRNKTDPGTFRSRPGKIPSASDRYVKQIGMFLESGLITRQEYMDLLSHHEKER